MTRPEHRPKTFVPTQAPPSHYRPLALGLTEVNELRTPAPLFVDKHWKEIPNSLISEMQDLIGITDDQALDLIKDFGVDAHCNMMGRISALFAGGDDCSRNVAGAGQAGGGAQGVGEDMTTGARNGDIFTGTREEDMGVYCVIPGRDTGGGCGWSSSGVTYVDPARSTGQGGSGTQDRSMDMTTGAREEDSGMEDTVVYNVEPDMVTDRGRCWSWIRGLVTACFDLARGNDQGWSSATRAEESRSQDMITTSADSKT